MEYQALQIQLLKKEINSESDAEDPDDTLTVRLHYATAPSTPR